MLPYHDQFFIIYSTTTVISVYTNLILKEISLQIEECVGKRTYTRQIPSFSKGQKSISFVFFLFNFFFFLCLSPLVSLGSIWMGKTVLIRDCTNKKNISISSKWLMASDVNERTKSNLENTQFFFPFPVRRLMPSFFSIFLLLLLLLFSHSFSLWISSGVNEIEKRKKRWNEEGSLGINPNYTPWYATIIK